MRSSASVPSYAAPDNAAQPGAVADDIETYSSGTLTAAYSNRKLYFSLNDDTAGGSCFYVSKVDVDAIVEDRTINYCTSEIYYYYPAVGVAGSTSDPLVAVATSWSSDAVYPSGAVKIYEDFTVDASGDFWNVAGGSGTYNVYWQGRSRWGDSLGIARDPVCGSFWTVTEYAPSTNEWSTRISLLEGATAPAGVCRLIFDDGFERGDRTNWSNY